MDKHAIQSSRKRSHVNRETNGWYRLEFPEGADLKIICTDLLTCPDIRYAILNHYGVLYSEPNDTLYQAGDQWVLEKIQMDLCWDLAKPDQTILVGIIDYGMDYDHEDLDEILHLLHFEGHQQRADGAPDDDQNRRDVDIGADSDTHGHRPEEQTQNQYQTDDTT